MRRLLITLLFMFSGATLAQSVSEYDMKATYLYNFSLYTEWPSLPTDNFNVCVLGRDNFGTALSRIEGKQISGHPVVVARLNTLGSIRKCQVLFISDRESSNLQRIFSELGDAPVLTVTETPPGSGNPSIINVFLDGQRVAFEINLSRARQSQLQLSSKLMQLARNRP